MTIPWAQVRTWRSGPLGAAGEGLARDAQRLEAARDRIEETAVPDSWSGLARFTAEARRSILLRRIERHLAGKSTMRRALFDAETDVETIERLVGEVEDRARAQEFTIGSDGSVTDGAEPPTFTNRFFAEEYTDGRRTLAEQIVADIETILVKAVEADATIADGIPTGFVREVDEYGIEDPAVAERWAELTDAERRAVIEQMIAELSQESGLDLPVIDWRDPSWGPNGQWSEGPPPTLSLNEGLLDDPRLLHSVAHEVRHGRQYEAIRDLDDRFHWPWDDDPFDAHRDDGITAEQTESWKENFADYQSTSDPSVSYDDYFNQPVEADARDSGREYLDGLTAEEIDRLLEESR
ncbi:hypothetical protein [Nocardioides sp.]|uniref:hypothetical protein n=1 Tax=Nocardioides sp. TaxID=35761 RepID=UPI00321B61DD